jgi:hypothetical protein
MAFERPDLDRHGGLGQVEFGGGARKTEVARHGFESLQLAQGGIFHRQNDL